MSLAAGPASEPTRGDWLRKVRIAFASVVAVVVIEAIVFVRVTLGATAAPMGAQVVVAAGVALVGSATVAARARFLRAAWRFDTASNLAAGYVARFGVQSALALGVANAGFVGAIITGAWWVTVVGLVFFVAPALRIAPTTTNLARQQAELAAQGCRLDLVQVLRGSG